MRNLNDSKIFSNRVIIIDEAHNFNPNTVTSKDKDEKQQAKNFQMLL